MSDTLKIREARVKTNKDGVHIFLPKSVAADVKLDGVKTYFYTSNGALVLTGENPTVVIPPLNDNPEDFEPQD